MVISFYLRLLNRSNKFDNNAPSDEALRVMICTASPKSSRNTFSISTSLSPSFHSLRYSYRENCSYGTMPYRRLQNAARCGDIKSLLERRYTPCFTCAAAPRLQWYYSTFWGICKELFKNKKSHLILVHNVQAGGLLTLSQLTVMLLLSAFCTARNPAGNAAALTVTPLGGGTRPVSAHLTIIQIG